MNLWQYIQGNRKGKDARRLEREAMEDPFLADALEGYDRTPGDPTERIQEMQQQVSRRSAKRNRSLMWSGIAAAILLLIGIGGYFLLPDGREKPLAYTLEKEKLQEESSIAPLLMEDTIVAQAEAEKEIAQIQQETARMQQAAPVAPPPPPKPQQEILSVVEDDMAIAEDFAIIENQAEMEDERLIPDLPMLEDDSFMPVQKQATARYADLPALTKIQGRIVDTQGEPIIGANVQVSGKSVGTISDSKGHFKLTAHSDDALDINFIGYEPVHLPVTSLRDTALIALNESKDLLEEVVVVGYGTAKKPKAIKPEPLIGDKAYRKYLQDSIRRPEDPCAKGRVKLTFSVDNQGRPYDLKITRSLCPPADDEAERLILEGPDWTTGNKEVEMIIKF